MGPTRVPIGIRAVDHGKRSPESTSQLDIGRTSQSSPSKLRYHRSLPLVKNHMVSSKTKKESVPKKERVTKVLAKPRHGLHLYQHRQPKFHRQKNGVKRQGTNVIHVRSNSLFTHGMQENTFMYHEWIVSDYDPSLNRHILQNANIIKISETCKIADVPDRSTNIVYSDSHTGFYIAGVISRRQCQEMNKMRFQRQGYETLLGASSAVQHDDITGLMRRVLLSKNDVKRGKQRYGINDAYKCFGYRMNYLDATLGQYVFKKGLPKAECKSISTNISKLVSKMEEICNRMLSTLPETSAFLEKKQEIGFPSIGRQEGGYATQFSVGRNYWSSVHTDDDYFYTVLSCLSSRENTNWTSTPPIVPDCEPLYYFCFPSYNLSIPIWSGDILWFNPTVVHSCSNPRLRDSFIFSAYVSNKTVETAARHNTI